MLPAQCPKPREAQGIGSESFSRRGLLSSHQSGQMSVRGGEYHPMHACATVCGLCPSLRTILTPAKRGYGDVAASV